MVGWRVAGKRWFPLRSSATARAAAERITQNRLSVYAPLVHRPAHRMSLAVTGPTTGVVGSPTVLTATGHVPSDASLARYVYVYAIPASVASTCPTSRTGALQLSDATDAMGGESVAFIAVEGDFSVPVAYVPEAAGSFILCGYLSEMVYDDA